MPEVSAPETGSREDSGDRCLVVVAAGGVRYGLEVEKVLEVVALGEVTPLFQLPPHVLGVTSVRGRVLPVGDLAGLLGLDPGPRPPHVGLLVRHGDLQAIVAVDAVDRIAWTAGGELEEVPSTVGDRARAHFLGLFPSEPPVMVLDPEWLFLRDGAWPRRGGGPR